MMELILWEILWSKHLWIIKERRTWHGPGRTFKSQYWSDVCEKREEGWRKEKEESRSLWQLREILSQADCSSREKIAHWSFLRGWPQDSYQAPSLARKTAWGDGDLGLDSDGSWRCQPTPPLRADSCLEEIWVGQTQGRHTHTYTNFY